MSSPTAARTEPEGPIRRLLHWLFKASLLVKGLMAAGEAACGVALLLVPFAWLTALGAARAEGVGGSVGANLGGGGPVEMLTGLIGAVLHGLTPDGRGFFAVYLVAHGLVKLAMVLLLGARHLWAYPASMLVLLGLAGFEIHEAVARHAVGMGLLALFDLFMIFLVWREWIALTPPRGGTPA